MEVNKDYISFLKDLKKFVDDFKKNVNELNNKHIEKIIHPNCFSSWNDLFRNLQFNITNDVEEIRKWIFNLINLEVNSKIEEIEGEK